MYIICMYEDLQRDPGFCIVNTHWNFPKGKNVIGASPPSTFLFLPRERHSLEVDPPSLFIPIPCSACSSSFLAYRSASVQKANLRNSCRERVQLCRVAEAVSAMQTSRLAWLVSWWGTNCSGLRPPHSAGKSTCTTSGAWGEGATLNCDYQQCRLVYNHDW